MGSSARGRSGVAWLVGAGALALVGLSVAGAPSQAAAKTCAGAVRPAALLSAAQESKALLCSVNRVRRTNGVAPVRPTALLKATALAHSVVMVAGGCFDHQCPGEPSFGSRLRSAGYPLCGCAWHAAENIAYGEGSRSAPAQVVDAWMNSPEHRAAMLDPRLRWIGIGIVPGSPASRLDLSAATYTIDLGTDG